MSKTNCVNGLQHGGTQRPKPNAPNRHWEVEATLLALTGELDRTQPGAAARDGLTTRRSGQLRES
jgi:hypothetical protein